MSVAEPQPPCRRGGFLAVLGPGLLVAATGVGAGDLATAAFTGSRLGVAVLWAVVLGAAIKLLLNEGLARYQLATGETLVEGVLGRAPRVVRWAFLGYFLLWSFLVGSALLSAAGAASLAILPLTGEPATDKLIYGLLHSAAALALIRLGGYRPFEKAMSAAVAVMAVTAVASAVRLGPAWGEVARGLVVPAIPELGGGGLGWTLALMGGIGGTVTVLSYGYWIREEGRTGRDDLRLCRLDLAIGYAVTALFGVAMVILGSRVEVSGSGVRLLVTLGDLLRDRLGPEARLSFLVGAWAAVATSVLGVWQGVPYLFADLLRLERPAGERSPGALLPGVSTSDRPYRLYLWGLSIVPCFGLLVGFARMQKLYATVGALFMPMLALALLVANRSDRLGELRDGWRTTTLLVAVLTFFGVLAWIGVD